MKYYCIIFLICISACKQKNNSDHQTPASKIAGDTIPGLRKIVSKNPVASYIIAIGNPKLDRKFGVWVYETPYTFKYLLVMQYDGMIQNDTLRLPNFGTWPAIKVRPGKEKLSCIIGFLDEGDNFKEYKMLSAKNDVLKLTVLKSYTVNGYQ
ncbi:MAG: hypothetical protein ABIO55_14335 [Ginsengibacter sp.]